MLYVPVARLVNCLHKKLLRRDHGIGISDGHIQAVIETLIQLLDSLPDAVVPSAFAPKCLANVNNFDALKPVCQYNTVLEIMNYN